VTFLSAHFLTTGFYTMSLKPESPESVPVTYSYDASGRHVGFSDAAVAAVGMTTDLEPVEMRSTRFAFEHDKQGRLYVMAPPDGKTETFRDNPVRHLVDELDLDSGEMRPVMKYGEPTFVCLSRGEREP
jgi:hypothetical protein